MFAKSSQVLSPSCFLRRAPRCYLLPVSCKELPGVISFQFHRSRVGKTRPPVGLTVIEWRDVTQCAMTGTWLSRLPAGPRPQGCDCRPSPSPVLGEGSHLFASSRPLAFLSQSGEARSDSHGPQESGWASDLRDSRRRRSLSGPRCPPLREKTGAHCLSRHPGHLLARRLDTRVITSGH